nr:stealth family protein [Homoserinimonas aerilata]
MGGVTPAEAARQDLAFLRGVLDASEIPFILVRGNDARPVIAVDRESREDLSAALAEACKGEPFYGRADKPSRGGDRTVLLSEGLLSQRPDAPAFTLFRPRVGDHGGLRLGWREGVRLEFWRHGDDEAVAPAPNALMRRHTPAAELVRTNVQRDGTDWPSVEGMFDPLVEDIRFDIDMVFSWVDGSDLDWQRQRAARMAGYVVGEGDDHEARFRQLDELRYALRSVHVNAPWVRRIFVATDSPRPEWLAEHPKVTFVRSEEFFADPSVLPTHNSHAVESQLHRIEGLSEHFLYSNDDMFFGRPVAPSMFFSPGGVTKFIQAPTRIGLGESHQGRSGFENAARVNRALLRERFGVTITRHLEHAATPLRRSVVEELEREFPAEFTRTAAAAFRQATDVSVTNSLYHYYAFVTGRAVLQEDARVGYIDTTARQGVADMRRLLRRHDLDFFCLNDGSFPELDAAEREREVRRFLEQYYPIPAPWENPDVE